MSDVVSEDQREQMADEPTVSSGEDGIDLSLISWMLELTPEERLRAAQDMIDTVWALRNAEQSS
ncbi:MAG: hypothetical protein GY906_35550 [bacterium]|nr:hypothetical protein [bacterium]